MEARYARVEARTTCGKCGSPLPLNGPLRTVHCNACQGDLNLPASIWKSLLEDIEEDWHEVQDGQGYGSKMFTGAGEFNRSWTKTRPVCGKCKTALPLDDAGVTDGNIHCPSCGAPTLTYPAPPWLREVLPNAEQIYGGERESEGAAAAGAVAEVDREAPQPIVMSCPQCGGALRVTVADQRVTPCSFCKTDVYLPDDVWKRLHPVKVVASWWVRFKGPAAAKAAVPIVEDEDEDEDEDEHEHEHEHEHEQVHESESSSWKTPVIVVLLIGGLVGLGYGGVHLASRFLDSRENVAEGRFQASGPRLGAWILETTACASGTPLGFSGAQLTGQDGHYVRVAQAATGLSVTAGPTMDGQTVTFSTCTVLSGEVRPATSQATGGQAVTGSVSVQCLEPSTGDALAGSATFEVCR